MKANESIRSHAKGSGVFLWELADSLGISAETLHRRLRHELPESEKIRIIEIIDQISKTKGE